MSDERLIELFKQQSDGIVKMVGIYTNLQSEHNQLVKEFSNLLRELDQLKILMRLQPGMITLEEHVVELQRKVELLEHKHYN